MDDGVILYKLTTADFYTRKGEHNACLWGEGVSHIGTGKGNLCGPGFIHAYTHPLLAVFLNPIHADLDNPVLWEAKGKIAKSDNGLKVGCVSLTTTRRLELPTVTVEDRVRFAILCAMEVYKGPAWTRWATTWLAGGYREAAAAAWAAEEAEEAAARAAARAAAWAAEEAEAEAEAAWAAAWAAKAGVSPLDLSSIAVAAVSRSAVPA